ncbi:hypothetical protein [Pedobacter sp. N23S346]|uniref:hypothetical protein n=1 Tax=Pedobacter sp. N23S346 TaxID=3402750 RepID=UPI003AC31199
MSKLKFENERLPSIRKLRGYAFDPSLSMQMDTSTINDIIYKVKWESLTHGPVGEYLEVVDYDPTLECFFEPVDLNHLNIVACDGLAPSESNPQFHQQMVYAVAMTTIANFEKALGRKILWSSRLLDKEVTGKYEDYVDKLRIYPHAFRDANAYYSPLKKSLLFGYFSASPANESLQMPGSLVFTCLSHDIIAHEITHAIIDGMHRNYNVATNPDVLAFHEAFADIVALFQHFSFPEVLKHQIARTRGDLKSENMLGKLAQQFGTAIGSYGSLRDAIGSVDEETQVWAPLEPDPLAYQNILEPHHRGSILVAAVFEAFISIYKSRTADLFRIASNGTGILQAGELHPDLVNRLASEASKSASHVLNMCIRALDYCPPLDINFGDYLRAIITADMELVSEDSKNYRLAFIDAFRRRGIYPSGIKTLSMESLRYEPMNIYFAKQQDRFKLNNESGNMTEDGNFTDLLNIVGEFLRAYENEIKYVDKRHDIFNITSKYISGKYDDDETRIMGLHRRISVKFPYSKKFSQITGLIFLENFREFGISASSLGNYHGPRFEINNLRLVNRTGPDGSKVNQVIFSIVQTIKGNLKDDDFSTLLTDGFSKENQVSFKGGCTLIFDLDTLELKYAISKPLIDTAALDRNITRLQLTRLKAIKSYVEDLNLTATDMANYFHSPNDLNEPFAFLHKH